MNINVDGSPRPTMLRWSALAMFVSVATFGCRASTPATGTNSPPTAALTSTRGAPPTSVAANTVPGVDAASATSSPTAVPSGCAGAGAATAAVSVPYARIEGVAPDLLSLDIYEPVRPTTCGPAPIVVFVHGGGFRTGDKANKIEDKVALFTELGWVLVSVNYRLSSADGPDDLVRYPTHELDVAAAVAWVQGHAVDFSGDPQQITLVGHSSGAFIVSLLSTDTAMAAEAGVDVSGVRCAVSLDTEYDVSNQVAQGGAQEELYRNAFGNDPQAWAKGSPVNHVTAGERRPAFMIVTQGGARRTSQARRFGEALVSGGTDATVIDVSPLDHEGVNAAVGAPGDSAVTPALIDFLASCSN